MTGWDILNDIVSTFPPIIAMVLVVAIVVVFIVGFGRHGQSFLRYGFKQVSLGSSLEKRFDIMESKIDGLRTEVKAEIDGLRTEVDGLRTELTTIKVNHFGHLKNYLGVLNGALLDKAVIDNETKARLDNEIRGM